MSKLNDFINRAEKLNNSNANSPEFKKWRNEVAQYLKRLFGDTSNEFVSFENIEFYNYYLTFDVLNGYWREHILKEKDLFKKGLKTAIFFLKGYEDEIIELEEKTQKAEAAEKAAGKSSRRAESNNKIFIIQGRNDGVKKQVANFLLSTVTKPIVLNVDERGIKMSSDTKEIYFKLDKSGKWQEDMAKKLKDMKLNLKKKKN
jgi:predicted extracellular nuclease